MKQEPTGRYGQEASPFGFDDLEVHRAACALRRELYAVARCLPADERYIMGSQLRRAAISVTANIAEGYGRFNWQEGIQFCRQARGSLLEAVDHLNTCADEAYIGKDVQLRLRAQAADMLRLLNGFIRYLREKKLGHD